MRNDLTAALAATLAATTLATPLHAQSCLEYSSAPAYPGPVRAQYIAAIDLFDTVNSKGVRLGSVLARVQQDRANVHKFRQWGPEDGEDSYFTTVARRQRISEGRWITWCFDDRADFERRFLNAWGMYQFTMFEGPDGRLVTHINPVD
jgi:hypothetical protein